MTLADLVGRRVWVHLVGDGAEYAVHWTLAHSLDERSDQRVDHRGALLLRQCEWRYDLERWRPASRSVWARLSGVLVGDAPRPADGVEARFAAGVGAVVGGVRVDRHSWAWLPPRPAGGILVVSPEAPCP